MINSLTSRFPRGFHWAYEQCFGLKYFRDLPTGFHSQQHQSDVQPSAYITHSDNVVQFRQSVFFFVVWHTCAMKRKTHTYNFELNRKLNQVIPIPYFYYYSWSKITMGLGNYMFYLLKYRPTPTYQSRFLIPFYVISSNSLADFIHTFDIFSSVSDYYCDV